MTNGSNNWGVDYSSIKWVENLLVSHRNVLRVERHDDICFSVNRSNQNDIIEIVTCQEYTAGHAVVQRALSDFGNIDIIHIGGSWNGYTRDAKQYCIQNRIGLYVSNEMSGALWKDDFWAYHQRDDEGNPSYFFRSA